MKTSISASRRCLLALAVCGLIALAGCSEPAAQRTTNYGPPPTSDEIVPDAGGTGASNSDSAPVPQL